MPKVTDEYLEDKKNYILECTKEILKEKPLYAVTMRDIIKKAGFSQGIIYHYYSSLDEIYVDYINKNTTYHLLEQNIDALLLSKKNEKEIIAGCIIEIGTFIEHLLKNVGSKTCFEFTVSYAYDLEKRATVFPQLQFKQSLEYAQNKIMEFTLEAVEKGVFHPQVPFQSIILFVGSFIDGIVQNVATGVTDANNSANIPLLFHLLARAVIGILDE